MGEDLVGWLLGAFEGFEIYEVISKRTTVFFGILLVL